MGNKALYRGTKTKFEQNNIGGQGKENQFSIFGEQGNKPIYPMEHGEIVTYPLSG